MYINYNGKLLSEDTVIVTSSNRAFRYGDGLFESVRMINYKLFFFDEHYNRLLNGMIFLKMIVPEFFTKEYFLSAILKLAKKNKISGNARIRLTVFRNQGGLYAPIDNTVSYLIEVFEINSDKYLLNKNGIKIDIFNGAYKTTHVLSNFKTANCLVYVLAGIYKDENKLDDCIILNNNNNIAEAISSNIFIVKNNQLLTPPLTDGCVSGIMRGIVMRLTCNNKILVTESSINYSDLLNADEVFLTNVIEGIKWVEFFRSKKFSNNIAKLLTGKLNELY